MLSSSGPPVSLGGLRGGERRGSAYCQGCRSLGVGVAWVRGGLATPPITDMEQRGQLLVMEAFYGDSKNRKRERERNPLTEIKIPCC